VGPNEPNVLPVVFATISLSDGSLRGIHIWDTSNDCGEGQSRNTALAVIVPSFNRRALEVLLSPKGLSRSFSRLSGVQFSKMRFLRCSSESSSSITHDPEIVDLDGHAKRAFSKS
jgi:hypothetical protein